MSFFNRRRLQIGIFWIGLGVLILHLLFEIVRWQMAFAYFAFVVMGIMLIKRSASNIVIRILGFIGGLLLIGTSYFYSLFMPIIALPVPSGIYSVGSTNYTILDKSREEIHSITPNDYRELFVEVWYPANLNEVKVVPDVNPLWQELYRGGIDRISFFMNYLKAVDTNSYPDIPVNTKNAPYPIILFNHGLQMFTSQNTMLMEHLASHGYIILSIAHPYESLRVNLPGAGTILPEFITSLAKFRAAMEWIEKTSAPILIAKDTLQYIRTSEERANIMLRAIETSEMNQMVSDWEQDNRFVLDQLLNFTDKLPFQNIMDTTRIGIMGMSIGGATATEVCKADKRIKAAINVDGLQYGKRNNDSLNTPFMMIYSKDGMGLNEFLRIRSKNDFHEYTFEGARHADFTDLTLIWPVLRIYGQLGEIPGERMILLTNKVILNFWDHYLKGQALYFFEEKDYPEFKTTIQYKSSQ